MKARTVTGSLFCTMLLVLFGLGPLIAPNLMRPESLHFLNQSLGVKLYVIAWAGVFTLLGLALYAVQRWEDAEIANAALRDELARASR